MQAVTRLDYERTYIPELGLTVDHISPGRTYSTYEATVAAVQEHNCLYVIQADDGMVPERLIKGTRSKLYKKTFVELAGKGYRHIVFAVGPLAHPDQSNNGRNMERAERYGRKIVVGVIR